MIQLAKQVPLQNYFYNEYDESIGYIFPEKLF